MPPMLCQKNKSIHHWDHNFAQKVEVSIRFVFDSAKSTHFYSVFWMKPG